MQYRAGDILLPATGTLAADSGRSIFLEESLGQRGKLKHFRWEIPYQCIVRIEEKPLEIEASPASTAPAQPTAARAAAVQTEDRGAKSSLLPLPNRPTEA